MENEEQKNEELVSSEKTIEKKQSFKLLYIGIGAALLILIVAGLGFVTYRALNKMATDKMTISVARTIKLPAGMVGNKVIAYSDFADDILAVTKFYEVNKANNQGTPPTISEIRKSVWERLAKNAVLKKLAKKESVSVSDEDVNNEYEKFSTEVGSAEKAASMVKDTYGWTPEQFKSKIIQPYLLQQKLAVSGVASSLEADSEKKANDVLAKVKEGKETFEDLAKQFSEDGSAENGGNLGWFGPGAMVKEFEDATSKLEVGKTSELVKSQFGFHIIKLLESKKDKNGEMQWNASHILIRFASFDQFLSQAVKDEKIWKWVKVE